MHKTSAALAALILVCSPIGVVATSSGKPSPSAQPTASTKPVVTRDAARSIMMSRWPDIDPNSAKAKCYVACTSGDGALGCRFCVSACGLPRKMSKSCPD